MITWTPELIPIFEINLPVRFAPQTPSSESRVPGKVLQKEWPSFLLTMERRDKDSNDRMQNWRLQILFWVVGRVVTHPVTNCVTAAPTTWQLDYARCTMSLCFHVLPGEAQPCIALKHRGRRYKLNPPDSQSVFETATKSDSGKHGANTTNSAAMLSSALSKASLVICFDAFENELRALFKRTELFRVTGVASNFPSVNLCSLPLEQDHLRVSGKLQTNGWI